LVEIDDGTVFSTEDLADIRSVINETATHLDSLLQEAMTKGSPQAQQLIQSKIMSLAQGFKQYAALSGEQAQTSQAALNYIRMTDYAVQSAAIQAGAQNNMRVGAALQTNITGSPGMVGPGGMPMTMGGGVALGPNGVPLSPNGVPMTSMYQGQIAAGAYQGQVGPYSGYGYPPNMINTPYPPTLPPVIR
jgi:hypothetical protein